jgi:polysaccharide pyruvyl transferase WcaK-like protein
VKEQVVGAVMEGTSVQGMSIQERLSNAIMARIKRRRFLFVPLKIVYTMLSGVVNGPFEFAREFWFSVRAITFIRKIDLVVIAGSGVLSDHSGGTWNFPYSVFKWSVLSKLAGAKIAFVSVGAGPINSVRSKYLLKYALSLAEYRSFRDEDSRRLIESIGVKGNNRVFPDLVQGLKINNDQNTGNKIVGCVVGINPFPHYWYANDPEAYSRYVRKTALFVSWLVENRYRVVFFPTHLRADYKVINDIREIMSKQLQQNCEADPFERPIHGIGDLLCQISVMDLVVATRFHGIVLSFLMNKPVIGISNQPKMDSLMRDMGQGDYLLDLERFDVETLRERFLSLEANRDKIKRDVQPIISGYREALETQYREVFKLVNVP